MDWINSAIAKSEFAEGFKQTKKVLKIFKQSGKSKEYLHGYEDAIGMISYAPIEIMDLIHTWIDELWEEG